MQSKLYQAKHIKIVCKNIIRNTRKINVFTSISIYILVILMNFVMCVGTCIDLLWRNELILVLHTSIFMNDKNNPKLIASDRKTLQ